MGQTVLIDPNSEGGFEQGASISGNGWTAVQSTVNTWRASSLPVPYSGNNAAFISATSGSDYVYDPNSFQTSHIYRDVTVPAGENLINLNFYYKNPGENLFDRLLVYVAPTSVFPIANEPLSSFIDIANATLVYTDPASVTTYTAVSLELPQTLAGTTFRLIFTWQNDDMDGSGIPVALDNIGLTSQVSNFGQPLNGFYTINNLSPTSNAIPNPGSNFNNFNDAISYLNTYGIAGDVRFDVAAGQTFNHTPLSINRSGTATDTIAFVRSGIGVNPVIIFSGGTAAADVGLLLNGVDYITIDGIDISPNPNPGTSVANIEFPIRVTNVTATNGSQFNRIQNLTITHNQLYTQNIALLQSTTAAPTALSGTNSNNIYDSITILNSLNGIRINSNATNRDEFVSIRNCRLGAIAGPSSGGSGSSYGIYLVNPKDPSIKNNCIQNMSSPGGAANVLDGIYVSNATGLTTISGNKVRGLRNTLNTSVCAVSGIRCVVASGGSANIYNNFVSDLATSYSSITNAVLLKGLSIQPLTAVSTTSVFNVDYNNVSIDGTANTNVSNACLEAIQTGPILNIRNNVFANFTTGQTGTPFHYVMVVPNLTITAAGSISNNNDLYLQDASNGVIVRKTSATATNYGTVALWNAASSGQDATSISVNPEFTNNDTDLHVLSSALDGTASMTGITWVSDDFDGQQRAVTPDIGADEFSLIQHDISFISFLSPVFDDCFTNQEQVTIRIRNLAYLAHDFILKPLTIQLTVSGPVPTTVNLTISDNSLNGDVPLGSLAYLNIPVSMIDLSAYGAYTLSCQLSSFGDQNGSNDLSLNYDLENATPAALPVAVAFDGYSGSNLGVVYPGWVESLSVSPVSGSSDWTSNIGLDSPTNVTASINYNTSNASSVIVGPKISALFNTFVTFDLALTATSSIVGNGAFDSDDTFSLLVSTDCGFTFTEVLVFDQSDILGNQLTTVEFFLGAFAGEDIILAFRADDGSVNGPAFNLHLDNINLFNSTQEKIAIVELVTPVQSSCYTENEEVSVTIKNTGFVPIDLSLIPLDLQVEISGPNPATLNETFTSGVLQLGQEVVYTFSSLSDMTSPGVYTFDITASINSSTGLYEDSLRKILYGQNPTPVLIYEDTACLLSEVTLSLGDPIHGITSAALPAFVYGGLPVALPDVATIDVPITVTGSGGYASQLLSVEIDSVLHTNVTQLRFELVAPDGSSILLTQLNAGSGPGFYSTTFSANALDDIQTATSPYTGIFHPETSFSSLTGSANGTWHLRISDLGGGITGILHKWSLNLAAGNAIASHSWTSQNTEQSSAALTATYLIENDSYIYYSVTDAMGCTSSDSAQIIYPVFADAPVQTDPLCFGDSNGSITSNISGGFGSLDYVWSSSDVGSIADQLAAGTYTLDVTDAYGCAAQYIYTLSEPSELVVSATATPITCAGCTSDISVSASGGTAPYTGAGSFTETAAGTYSFTVTDANGCSAVATVIVDDISGIDDLSASGLTIYPNPFRDQFEITIDPENVKTVKLYDAHSRAYRVEVRMNAGSITVLTDQLSTGVYFVHLEMNDHSTKVSRVISY